MNFILNYTRSTSISWSVLSIVDAINFLHTKDPPIDRTAATNGNGSHATDQVVMIE